MTTTGLSVRSADTWANAAFDEAAGWLESCTGWRDVFGDVGDEEWLDGAKEIYRAAAQVVHPDRVEPAREVEAAICFVTLGGLWEQAQRWGGSGGSFQLSTKRGSFVCNELMARGSLSDVYRCAYLTNDGSSGSGVAKIFRSATNSDLAQAESRAWGMLANVDPAYQAYFPEPVSCFRHRGDDGVIRRVNISVELDGFYSLADVSAAYPLGVEARAAVWMWRRLLVALGATQRAGLVHGCVTPEHVMIHPEKHGLVLVDWCYSVDEGTKLGAMEPRWAGFYPLEVHEREAVSGASDIYMAAKTMMWLMGDRAPKQLLAFGQGCMLRSAGMRPNDAWELLGELDELCERLWGPRKFIPFVMPSDSTTSEATGVRS
jgi:hypothetical protein